LEVDRVTKQENPGLVPDTEEERQRLCEALREFDTATVSNAIETFGIRDRTEGYASREVQCHFPALGSLVGFAVTCTLDTTTRGPRRPSRLNELIELVESAPKPAVVVCQYIGPDRTRGCFAGDMIVALLQRLGAVGLVTDAANRDLQMIQDRAPGFHLFGSGMVASHGNSAIEEVNVPVSILGLDVRPGDLIHADVNGVISVPLDIAHQLPARAADVRRDEQEVFDLIQDIEVPLDVIKSRFIH
jgi:4-hydroxy-4-methyl-2-oxoglutarate aldolase